MAEWTAELEALKITRQLRQFIRAEYKRALRLTDENGKVWTAPSAYRASKANPDIPCHASRATFERFHTDKTDVVREPAVIIAVAGFLLAHDFITLEDIRNHRRGAEERLVLALGEAFNRGPLRPANLPTLAGVYRHFYLKQPSILEVTVLTIADLATGAAMSAALHCTQYEVDDWSDLLSGTDGLDPSRLVEMGDFLDEYCSGPVMTVRAHGAVVSTPALIFAIPLGGDEPIEELLAIEEVHTDETDVIGLRISSPPNTTYVTDGAVSGDQPRGNRPYAERDMDFYPQEKPVPFLPGFGSRSLDDVSEGDERPPLKFMDDDRLTKTLTLTERLFAEADARGMEGDAALHACSDATERLIVAIDRHRVQDAAQAVRDGAALNLEHPSFDLPLIHTAAILGMTSVVEAMLATGAVDLTVRDRHGRLASGCAELSCDDDVLSDMLLDAEIAQFRAKGLDPRRPGVPGYGAYRLPPDPSAE